MALSPDLVDEPLFLALSIMTDCMVEELAKANGPHLCYAGQWMGQTEPPAPLMNCATGPCGVAWVSLSSVYESTNFPLPAEPGAGNCAGPLALEFTMGVLRCRPKPEGKAQYPTPQAIFEANRLTMSDERALRRAILCCFPAKIAQRPEPYLRDLRPALGTWSPSPSSAGGSWSAYIG